MKTNNATKPTAAAPPAPIRADEVYLAKDAARRLRWGRKTLTRARREGLRVVPYGRELYIRGAEILRWFAALEDRQGGQADG